MSTDDPTVLVVEDNEKLADMYTSWLAETYAVVTAYDGERALALLSDRIDVVLLDRLMPGLSGDEVLETVRERELSCRVALVTAVEPDPAVARLQFDDYLVKPVFERDLYHAVERLLTHGAYTDPVREYESLADRRATLETHLSDDERAVSDAYDDLLDDLSLAERQTAETDERWRDEVRDAAVFRRLAHHLGADRNRDD